MEKMPNFQVKGIILAREINKYFLTGLKEHTVHIYTVYIWLDLNQLSLQIKSFQMSSNYILHAEGLTIII